MIGLFRKNETQRAQFRHNFQAKILRFNDRSFSNTRSAWRINSLIFAKHICYLKFTVVSDTGKESNIENLNEP